MIVIWRGKGFVIGLVAIACVWLASTITSAIAGDAYVERHAWWGLAGFWVAAAVVYALRSWLGVGRQRTLIDKKTGREVRVTYQGTHWAAGLPTRGRSTTPRRSLVRALRPRVRRTRSSGRQRAA